MSHEIGQLDIPGIQLRDSKTQPKVSHSREIGEAQIIHNIFGKAKVRIIRKHDKLWRMLWLAGAFAVGAILTVILQTWYVSRQAASEQSVALALPAKAVVQESPSTSQPESAVAPAISPVSAVIATSPAAPLESGKSPVVQKVVPQALPAVKAAEKTVVLPPAVQPKPVVIPPKPVATAPAATVQPVTAGNSQMIAVGAGNNALKSPAITPLPAKPVLPKQAAPAPVTPAKPVATASSPAAAPAMSIVPVKEDIPAEAADADKPLSAPINLQNN